MSHTGPFNELKRLLPQCLLKDQLRIGWALARWLQQQPAPQTAPPGLERWLAEARDSMAMRNQRVAAIPAVHYPKELPITARRHEIVDAIRAHPVLVIAGETGSGKTTQLPKMCLEAGLGNRGRIGCTQPRRVAALSLSRRVAEELDVEWGRQVGCKIRFSDQTHPETCIKFVTDGMLLAEAQADRWLSEYEAIIIDEAHERSLNIDFLLGLLKNLLRQRPDLKLIITSATIDTQAFARHFDQAPIIEVSGRLYPVEVRYVPLDEESEEQGEFTYVDAAVRAVDGLLDEASPGDVLVFMPSERDILETRDALQERGQGAIELIPLFGRLSAAEQQRVFAPSLRRKIVIATNIAETSLTVPGIRYVVDTGLARLSRYNARTRTKRLPIEPIAQSSANQRRGRCGRVAEGVCIRLYSETDFQERPLYTQPEIQRANLAEVILRMKAFNLGDIETFPFVNPPAPAAIQGGYQLLQELGALDEQCALTELGHRLARLPIDPTIGRMVLQARQEMALADVLVIAAGLSIQDPRERPMERRAAATAAHQRFQHPRSDFLALLNIWNAYHDSWDSLKKQSQIRKFCRDHFLSYPRMREWRDIHAQLQEAIEDLDGPIDQPPPTASAEANYAAIHRSILTGLWSNVAERKERNVYHLGGNRPVMVFPGSGLFERTAEKKQPQTRPNSPAPAGTRMAQPKWTVAGEIVETSRLFARTVAEIDPLWIVELAPHLCRRTHLEPHWEASAGRVIATERVTLNGLVVLERQVDYGKPHPVEATEMFIRSALIEEGLANHFVRRESAEAGQAQSAKSRATRAKEVAESGKRTSQSGRQLDAISPISTPEPERDLAGLPSIYRFLAHNHRLRQKIEIWQTRLPYRQVADMEETLFQFYARHLAKVSSIADLNRLLHTHDKHDPEFLHLRESELLGDHATDFDPRAFPDTVAIGDQNISLTYAYAPGEERDGVTLRLPFNLAQIVDARALDWAVPGLREPQIQHLLESLPKAIRRQLMPLAPKAREMARTLEPRDRNFVDTLTEFVQQQYGVTIPPKVWNPELLPAYLRPRYEIVGRKKMPVACGRDLQALRDQLRETPPPADRTAELRAWQQAVQRWERYSLREWNVGDVPDQITVAAGADLSLFAYPALHVEENEVCLRLFHGPVEAGQAHPQGVIALAQMALQRELAWLQKDLRSLAKWRDLYVTLGPVEELEDAAFANLRQHLFESRAQWPRTAADFGALVADVRRQLPGIAQQLSDWTGEILRQRQAILLLRRPYPQMLADLNQLAPRQFLRHIPFARLPHLPRYLRALHIRAERAAVSPAKDQEKSRRLEPFLETWEKLRAQSPPTRAAWDKLHECRWLLEEYKVSLFAQELGTAGSVSPAKLTRVLAEAQSLLAPG